MLFYIILFILLLWALSFILPVGSISSNVHGDAHFGKQRLSKHNDGLVINGSKRISASASFIHAAVVAGTGGGKSTGYIIPNIITLALSNIKNSLVITDVKGELFALLAFFLEQQGYKVLVFNVKNPANSIRFNPLKRLSNDAEIKNFANTLFTLSNSNAKTEGIWKFGSSRIIETLITALKNAPDDQLATLSSLIYLLNQFGKENSKELDEFITAYAPSRTQNAYKFIKDQETKILYGQLSTSQTSVSNYDTEQIRTLTNTDTIDFQEFRKRPVALFLNFPVGVADQYSSLISLFYMQFFRHILNTPLDKNDLPIYFLLDEFGNLKKIPDFARICTLIRSKKCSLSLVLQGISQLDYVYGKELTETILGNISSLLILTGLRAKRDLDYISDLLGTSTKEVFTPGSFGIQFISRNLLTKGELRTLSRKALFIHANKAPQKIKMLPIYKNKKLMKKAGLASVDGELVPIRKRKTEPVLLPPLPEEEENVLEQLKESAELETYKAKLNDILS